MGGDQFIALGVDAHLATAALDAQLLSHQPEGRRVVGLLEDHMAVAVQLHLFPDDQVVVCGRQRAQCSLLCRLEAHQRLLFGGAMCALARCGQAPLTHGVIGGMQVGHFTPRHEVAFDIVHATLDLAFVLRRGRATGRNAEPIMLGAFQVGVLHLWVIPCRFHNPRLQVVDDDPLRHTVEEGQRIPVQPQPALHLLVKDELHIHMAAPTQRHHERPCLAPFVCLRIQQVADIAEVHLRLFAGLALDPHKDLRLLRRQLAHQPIHGVVAARVALLLQPRHDRGDLHPGVVQFDDLFFIRCHRRPVLRRLLLRQRPLQQFLQLLWWRQRS